MDARMQEADRLDALARRYEERASDLRRQATELRLDFEADPDGLGVRRQSAPRAAKGELQDAILGACSSWVTVRQVADTLGLFIERAASAMSRFTASGLLEARDNPGGRGKQYRRADAPGEDPDAEAAADAALG